MEQVIAQERSVPLQQNMVVIYRVEEAQKYSIGRVIHFDSENVSWKYSNVMQNSSGNQFLNLQIFPESSLSLAQSSSQRQDQ